MMVRLLAFAFYACDSLVFCEGIGEEGKPDLIKKDYSDTIELWIDVGLPSVKKIRKACSIAKQVVIFVYGKHDADSWWNDNKADLQSKKNLTIRSILYADTQSLSNLATRTMELSCTIEDGQITILSDLESVTISPATLFQPS